MKKKWNLPPNWNWIPLSDLITDMSGGTWGTDDDPNGPAVLRPNNIGLDGYVIFEDLRFREIPLGQLKKQKLCTGDVILTKSNSLEQVGRCAFFIDPQDGKSYVASNFLQRLRFNENRVNPKYGFWFLYSKMAREYFQSQAKGSSASLKNLTSDVISSLEFPIPIFEDQSVSLQIQNQIVERIEALFAELSEARRLHEKIVADTNRLMDAVLAEYFPKFEVALPEGWEWKPISFLAHDTDRQNPTITTPNEYFNYIDISGVDNAIGAVTDPKSMLGQDAPSRARKIVHTNDVIFATTRPYLKNIALIPLNLDHSICSTGFCVLVPKADNCVPQYLYYAARSESVIQQLIPKQRGASYPAVLDQDIFGSFIPIPYPGDPAKSKTSQEIIAKRITEMGESVSEAQIGNTKTGALLNQIEQSILAQAFRGEL